MAQVSTTNLYLRRFVCDGDRELHILPHRTTDGPRLLLVIYVKKHRLGTCHLTSYQCGELKTIIDELWRSFER